MHMTPRAAALRIVCLLLTVAVGGAARVSAQSALTEQEEAAAEGRLTSKFAINDADPVSSVPTPNEAMQQPIEMGYHIMMLSEKADDATKRGDHVAAARYWLALAKAGPDRAMPESKACQSFLAAGDFKSAIDACRRALGKQGVTVKDNLQYVQLVLEYKAASLTPEDIADVDAIADHVKQQIPKTEGPVVAARIRCELATKLSDAARLQACVKELNTLAPNDPQTFIYAWSLTMQQGKLDKAEDMLQKSKLPASTLAPMAEYLKREQQRRAPWWRRMLGDVRFRLATAAVLLTMVAASMLALYRRRQRLHQA